MTASWIAGALVALLLGALEWRREDQRHRWSRLLLLLVGLGALMALISPPQIRSGAQDPGTVVLVTPGATPGLVRSARADFPGVPVVVWPDSVADLGVLRMRFPAMRRLVVVGWGLRTAWWDGHDALVVEAIPAPPPSGFRVAPTPGVIRLGERANLSASLLGSADSVVFLEGPGQTSDTIRLDPAAEGRFAFGMTPKAVGRLEYVLSSGSAPPETLRVAVVPSIPPAVLVLEGAPSFETTFLRRWLASQGARIAIRTRLSRDRDREERVNAAEMPLDPITPGLLAAFDLVIVDGSTLRSLTGGERATFDTAIRDGGLGILVLPDSLARGDREFFPFAVARTGDGDDRRVRPRWVGASSQSMTAVPAAVLEIGAAPGQAELLQDPVGRILAASVRRGAGRIATTLVLAPSRWQLEGDSIAYGDYWARLYAAVARGRGEEWTLATDGPLATDLGVDLGISTDDPSPLVEVTAPDGSIDTIGVAQDLADPARWWGRLWPRMPGWHQATNRNGEAYPFHVASLRLSAGEAGARLRATAARAALSPAEAGGGSPGTRRPMPPGVPFIVLVTTLAALWAEGRGLWTMVRPRARASH